MIRVTNLTKRYGKLIALDNISFQVNHGEILGFLGPNGAGKTTTMRIITGFTPPTEGEIRVGDFDIVENPIEAKAQIGYLPENPPLYNDMTVESYLDFVADIKQVVSKNKKIRIDTVMQECGIEDVGKRLIGNLSKGYRQRIGIAQSLIHDPSILVLDEPTIGLDPGQITEIRDLIKSLSGERTVLLSTHMLPEVNMICSRVVIINKGKIALEESLDKLTEGLSVCQSLLIKINYRHNNVRDKIRSLPSVSEVNETSAGEFVIKSQGGRDIREEIAKMVVDNGWGLLEMRPITQSLEEIFLRVISSEGE